MSNGLPYPNSSHYTDLKMREVRKTLTNRIGKYTLQDDVRAMGKVPVSSSPAAIGSMALDMKWLLLWWRRRPACLSENFSKEIFEPLGMESTGYRYFGNMRKGWQNVPS